LALAGAVRPARRVHNDHAAGHGRHRRWREPCPVAKRGPLFTSLMLQLPLARWTQCVLAAAATQACASLERSAKSDAWKTTMGAAKHTYGGQWAHAKPVKTKCRWCTAKKRA